MKRYMVLEEDSLSKLCESVEKYLYLGWNCQGGICVFTIGYRETYYQAMRKDS